MASDHLIRLLIADDHSIIREGMAAILQRFDDLEVVGQARNGLEAVDLFRQLQPDVTLLDLRMPQMSGIQAIETIRAEFPEARIIVLSAYAGDEDIYQALRAGAKAYLLKDSSGTILVETIRAVVAGQIQLQKEVADKLAGRITAQPLTPRELEVLRRMATGMSNQEIAVALHITEGTVKAHVNSILGKLRVNDRTQAVTIAIRRGLVHLE